MRAITEGQGAGNGLGKTKAQAKAHGHTGGSLRIGAFQAEIAPAHGEASVDGFAHAAPAAPECVGRFVAVEREPAVGLVGGVELDLDGDGSGQRTTVGQQESNFLFSHIVRPFCKNLLVLYTTCKKHSGNSEKDGICRIQLIFSDCNHSGIDIKNSAAIRLQLKDRVRRNRGINPRKKSRKLITTRIPPILKNQQPDQYSEKIL